jgi:hypothetical protein
MITYLHSVSKYGKTKRIYSCEDVNEAFRFASFHGGGYLKSGDTYKIVI